MPERPLSKDSFVDQDEQNLYSDAKFRRRSRQISRILRIKGRSCFLLPAAAMGQCRLSHPCPVTGVTQRLVGFGMTISAECRDMTF